MKETKGEIYFDIQESDYKMFVGLTSDGRKSYRDEQGILRIRPDKKLTYKGFGTFHEIRRLDNINIQQTKVIFRKYKSGEIIALFPEELGNNNAITCSSYMQTGQHGSADSQLVISDTKPANELEYSNLKKELETIGYNLKVIKRDRYAFYQKRKNLIRDLRRDLLVDLSGDSLIAGRFDFLCG